MSSMMLRLDGVIWGGCWQWFPTSSFQSRKNHNTNSTTFHHNVKRKSQVSKLFGLQVYFLDIEEVRYLEEIRNSEPRDKTRCQCTIFGGETFGAIVTTEGNMMMVVLKDLENSFHAANVMSLLKCTSWMIFRQHLQQMCWWRRRRRSSRHLSYYTCCTIRFFFFFFFFFWCSTNK